MRVKGMQQSASIRSLSARDSRKELVTVRRRRLRSSTATTRAFPQTLSTKISAYSRTRTVRSSSAGARSQAAQRARERLRVPALRCARELLRPSLRRTRCQDAVPGRGATRAELQHGDSGRAAGTRCCRSPRPNPACPESRSSLGRARGRRHRERSGPARASPGAGIRVRGQRDVALERGDPWGSRASLSPPLGTLAAPAQSEPTPGPPCAEHRAMLGTRRTGRERLLCGPPRCPPSRPAPSRPVPPAPLSPLGAGGPRKPLRRRSQAEPFQVGPVPVPLAEPLPFPGRQSSSCRDSFSRLGSMAEPSEPPRAHRALLGSTEDGTGGLRQDRSAPRRLARFGATERVSGGRRRRRGAGRGGAGGGGGRWRETGGGGGGGAGPEPDPEPRFEGLEGV